jgi:uncharacterized protein YdeI (YjbR/CyaY-like superfamily)
MEKKEIATFCPASRQEWRLWLAENHSSSQAVWLIYHKKKSGVPSLSWSEAVDEALCFGWIDSVKKTIDAEKFMQFFSRRKPNSVWSTVNKAKVEQLIANGSMTGAGLVCIETAKRNGSWTTLDEAETLTAPEDLDEAFSLHAGSKDFFLGLSKSARKSILQWLLMAKRPETRQKRIAEIAELAGRQLKPAQFR